MMDYGSGEVIEHRLQHQDGEARTFYVNLPAPVRVGMEAAGHAQWFEQMLASQGSRARMPKEFAYQWIRTNIRKWYNGWGQVNKARCCVPTGACLGHYARGTSDVD
jgi:hypothetical protein